MNFRAWVRHSKNIQACLDLDNAVGHCIMLSSDGAVSVVLRKLCNGVETAHLGQDGLIVDSPYSRL